MKIIAPKATFISCYEIGTAAHIEAAKRWSSQASRIMHAEIMHAIPRLGIDGSALYDDELTFSR